MKLDAKTEQEMREAVVPKINTIEELNEYIQSCIDAIDWPKHDDGSLEHATDASGDAYGRAVYAMSLSAYATFAYVARLVGASGFQASCADLDFLKRTRHIDGPFSIVSYADLLYPQYDPIGRVQENINSKDTKAWLKQQAQKKLDALGDDSMASEKVIEHWKKLAA